MCCRSPNISMLFGLCSHCRKLFKDASVEAVSSSIELVLQRILNPPILQAGPTLLTIILDQRELFGNTL